MASLATLVEKKKKKEIKKCLLNGTEPRVINFFLYI